SRCDISPAWHRSRRGHPHGSSPSISGGGHHRGGSAAGDIRAGHGGPADSPARSSRRSAQRRDRALGLGDVTGACGRSDEADHVLTPAPAETRTAPAPFNATPKPAAAGSGGKSRTSAAG